jgi:MFS transporter, OFA family, oxalate/formate antiporter
MFKSNIPFSPKSLPFYYGWVIMPMALIGIMTSIPGQTAGFSAFNLPLSQALGISSLNLSIAYCLGTICSGFILPKAGKFLDEHGTRKTIFFVYLYLGLVLYYFSHCEAILFFLESQLPFIRRDVLYIGCLAVFILGLRFFGQGMLPMICNTMLGRWFDKKRGKVVALMGIVNSLAFNAAPFILSVMISAHGWQNTWLILAIVMGGGFLTLSWIFFRDNPEECGLYVDGHKPEGDEKALNIKMEGMTVQEATRTVNFKIVTIAISLYGMTLTGFTFNLEAVGLEAGMTQKQAMSMLVPVSIISVPIGFTTAWLSDHFSKKTIVLGLLFFQSIAYISLTFLEYSWGYYASVLFLGISAGMFGPIFAIAYPWFFGRRFLGSINGKVTSWMVISSALGPVIFTLIQRLTGHFTFAFYLCAVFPLIALIYGRKMTAGELYKLKKPE